MVERKKNTKTRRVASIFLLAVVGVCVESIMGLHNSAVIALDVAVALVSVFLLLALLAGKMTEKTSRNKEETNR
jgi:multisubunit Na+/H+ antiporter MnhB subunit